MRWALENWIPLSALAVLAAVLLYCEIRARRSQE
jgi:hypothetical protein